MEFYFPVLQTMCCPSFLTVTCPAPSALCSLYLLALTREKGFISRKMVQVLALDTGIVLCTNKGEADICGGSSRTERALQVAVAVIS